MLKIPLSVESRKSCRNLFGIINFYEMEHNDFYQRKIHLTGLQLGIFSQDIRASNIGPSNFIT